MPKLRSWLVQAREASGLTECECACALHRSPEAYAFAEENPGTLSLNEVRILSALFSDEGRRLVRKALLELA